MEMVADTGLKITRRASTARMPSGGYLFAVVKEKVQDYIASGCGPNRRIISLGKGDTPLPLPSVIAESMAEFAKNMQTSTNSGTQHRFWNRILRGEINSWIDAYFRGYFNEQRVYPLPGFPGPEGFVGYDSQYEPTLRQLISEKYYGTRCRVEVHEIFCNDGSKPDIGRLQLLFDPTMRVAVQDPAYPVYADSAVLSGRISGRMNVRGHYDDIVYLPCTERNDFFPDLSLTLDEGGRGGADIIYYCNPNNPTGVSTERGKLNELVQFALKHGKLIIYDAAYGSYVSPTSDVPRSIYEIEGARKCCIETNSFSKLASFTGVRLGWTVVPEDLHFTDGTPFLTDWHRISTTVFQGASAVSVAGGTAVLNNLPEVMERVHYYMANMEMIRETLAECAIPCYGGIDAPFVFAKFGGDSWTAFDKLLRECQIVTIPGSGFGPAGEGFLRISGYGTADDIKEACGRIRAVFGS
ncbi:hypothetical protein FOZ63_029053 [Perkinsus olseni]|uniref:Aminotransferase class I/classII large domain-containing protein n=1 Tax=Perkinsus olseni TaxID=32597 RepID=A0A7J6UIG8_PEROL|nr:hypothetical protein FOZ62_028505 [Perkinsus olseni]KAF4756983.1 hypothetical protein FOZ63_029053 [Perkinsus olseni]